MPDLLPYRGLSSDVESALVRLEGDVFDEAAYRVVIAERDRRIPVFLALAIPVWGLGFALVYFAQLARWLPHDAPWAYAFLPILFVAFSLAPLRPQAARDDNRLGAALTKWSDEARQRGLG